MNGCEWMRMDANGCEWMRMDGNGWEWMGLDENGRECPNELFPLGIYTYRAAVTKNPVFLQKECLYPLFVVR